MRCPTLNLGVVIPDKMIELARDNKPMYLFYPKNFYDVTGEHLDEVNMTERYEEFVDNPDIRRERIDPRALLERIAITQIESGYPYIMFEDNVNKVHALDNVGKVKFSNLCSEVLQVSEVSEFGDYGKGEDKVGLDISCNLGSLNIANVMAQGNIDFAVTNAVKALNEVSRVSDVQNAPGVNRANKEMRSIGLGAMNLHGYLASVGIPYTSEEAIEFADTFFMMVNFWSIYASMREACETGEVFYGFEGSKYATGEYFDEYIPKLPELKSDKVKSLFKGMRVPSEMDWRVLSDEVKEHGMYNSYRLCLAPTGSISYVQSATASVMPIMERVESRTYGDSKTVYPMPGLSPQTWFMYQEAYDMSMYKIIDLIATIQRHVDQGISFTVFVKDSITTRELTRIQLYAHHKGIKTLYYVRQKDVGQDECLSCAV